MSQKTEMHLSKYILTLISLMIDKLVIIDAIISLSKGFHVTNCKDNKIRNIEENDEKIVESGYRISPWIITNIMKIKEKEFKNAISKSVSKEETQFFKLNQDINSLKKDFAIMSVNINKYLNKRTV